MDSGEELPTRAGRDKTPSGSLHRSHARYHAQGVPAAVGDRNEFIIFLPQQIFSSADIVKTPMPSRRLEFFSSTPGTPPPPASGPPTSRPLSPGGPATCT